ncbi:MAG: metallophosphoesterase family protein [Candidatus Pacebacteria bacterium]|nr:metallophosphoesterase family protein [Candidatus Paceibacterota bacterium]
MKSTIILSDLHLGERVNKKRKRAFLEAFRNYDRIILNGDFLDDYWDYFKTRNSGWSPVFEFLKSKEVIYVFGNHDRDSVELRQATDDFVDTYCDECFLPVGEHELVIRHGHRIYPRPDTILYTPANNIFQKILKWFVKGIWKIIYPIILITRFSIEKYPKTLAYLQRWFVKPQNRRMKAYAKENLEPHQILVCGHSHYAQDLRDEQFINEGANSYNRIEYLSIRGDEMKLVVKKL